MFNYSWSIIRISNTKRHQKVLIIWGEILRELVFRKTYFSATAWYWKTGALWDQIAPSPIQPSYGLENEV
jgi:hypothetical protein